MISTLALASVVSLITATKAATDHQIAFEGIKSNRAPEKSRNVF